MSVDCFRMQSPCGFAEICAVKPQNEVHYNPKLSQQNRKLYHELGDRPIVFYGCLFFGASRPDKPEKLKKLGETGVSEGAGECPHRKDTTPALKICTDGILIRICRLFLGKHGVLHSFANTEL
jgi:hypothetical protein